MGCTPRLENHYPPHWMGAVRTFAVYIAMTFLRRVVTLSRSRKFVRYPEASWASCALGTIQASIALLVLLSLLHPSPAFAASPDLETVLTGSRQRIEKLDYRVSGRLTRVEGDGKRTNYKFVAKARWFPDGLSVLCEISGRHGEDHSSSAYEREWTRNHPGGTSWPEGRQRGALRTLERPVSGNRFLL
jgi:hypothetical protein